MNRMMMIGFAVAFFGGVAWVQSAQKGNQTKKGAAGEKAKEQPAIVSKPPGQKQKPLAVRLAQHVDFAGFDDPKTSLQEALQHLNDRYDINFDVDEVAFKEEGIADVLGTRIAEERPL